MVDTTKNNENKVNPIAPDKNKIQRRISAYSLCCEGRRLDEIAELFNVSERTIYRNIKWCREKIQRRCTSEIRNDILFDTFRRRAIIWSRFKKLAKIDISTNHFVSISKHLLELDKKTIDWIESITNSRPDFDKNNLNDILLALDNILRHKSDKELEQILEKTEEKNINARISGFPDVKSVKNDKIDTKLTQN